MAEIIGFIATELELRPSPRGGSYYAFRFAENSGTGENRKATFYDVRASISEVKAGRLSKGQPVRIRGRLDSQGFIRRRALEACRIPRSWEAIVRMLKERQALGSSIVLLTSSVEPYEFPLREEEIGRAAA